MLDIYYVHRSRSRLRASSCSENTFERRTKNSSLLLSGIRYLCRADRQALLVEVGCRAVQLSETDAWQILCYLRCDFSVTEHRLQRSVFSEPNSTTFAPAL